MTKREKHSKKKKEKSKGSFKGSSTTGIVRVNTRGGFGFVTADDPSYVEDIFIPKPYMLGAVDGDLVEISVEPESAWSKKGPEGKVIKILKRNRSHLAGTVIGLNNKYAIVYVPLLKADEPVLLELKKNRVVIGERVLMEVIEWGAKNKQTTTCLTKSIGHISDPSVDIEAAIYEFEIPSSFPSAVVEEAKSYSSKVPQQAVNEREDCREVETFTIDPDTAKDFDDALSLTKDKKGVFHLSVHIADVSHYVRPGTLLDKEAFKRANSTYFPGKCIPMLPSELSDNLCSLKPNVNRLTMTIFMDFDSKGSMIQYRIARTVIKSAKRFTYREAKEVLDGKKKSPHTKTLQLMVELCGLLKKQRYDRGSVEFAMPDLVVMVDEKGTPTGTDYVEYDITHQLVEEFMLKANETVARHLTEEGKGLPYRVHDEPSEENMRDFALLAQAFGFKLPNKPEAKDIQLMFEEAHGSPYGQYLATSYIRRMRLAIYSPVNIGHFGLSLTHYCHFTSPIRRYVDLVAHRLLFEKPYNDKILGKISDHCSERERISAKAEMSVVILKKMRLLKTQTEKEPKKVFPAIVTKLKPFGMFFEIVELMLEGFLHISEIGHDYWIYHESSGTLEGERTGKSFASGDKIAVRVKSIDLITCEAVWQLAYQKGEKA
jgi:ribonuclease R